MGVNLLGVSNVYYDHYKLSVLIHTPDMFDFTTEDRYWIEEEG